ncbi:MAG: TIGR02996 domain-containing protein [Planctomycetes bacterium]|nr:TIGR02996 domain-containing protein [Planctomycetota bacterium]
MTEEAGFIAAVLSEPEDRTSLLVYADWLDERDDRRAAYLRQMAAAESDEKWVEEVSSVFRQLQRWVVARGCGAGTAVRVTLGPFAGNSGEVAGLFVKNHRVLATVRLMFWGQPMELELSVDELERIAPR